MANIYISYSQQDFEFANQISNYLMSYGHTVQIGNELMPRTKRLSQSHYFFPSMDAIVILISENSLKSVYRLHDVLAVKSYVNEGFQKTILIPVLLGNVEMPAIYKGLEPFISSPPNVLEIVEKVNQDTAAFIGRKAAIKEEQAEIKKEIEISATKYINEALLGLNTREETNKKSAKSWYVIGWVSLVIGVVVALIVTYLSYINISNPEKLSALVLLSIKGIIVIALLIASSKYSFSLAKSYMAESLKNADRIHAISFGKFFIEAFGNNATISDIKEVFQHWNIETKSSFITLESKEYDPKLIENILKLAELLKSSNKEKS